MKISAGDSFLQLVQCFKLKTKNSDFVLVKSHFLPNHLNTFCSKIVGHQLLVIWLCFISTEAILAGLLGVWKNSSDSVELLSL